MVLLGFMGYLVILNILQVFEIPLDQITLYFALWNFSASGLISIFWKSPMIIQQGYLVIMSSLMAFSLNGFQAWTCWLVLAVLAIWDLIAVLCPFGPLRILIESSRSQNREIPALLYSVGMIYFIGMADADGHHNKILSLELETSPTTRLAEDTPHQLLSSVGQASSIRNKVSKKSAQYLESRSNLIPQETPRSAQPEEQPQLSEEQDEDEKSGLKLGLGDFIFYSVLISRTSMEDWVTTIACFVAILTVGLSRVRNFVS